MNYLWLVVLALCAAAVYASVSSLAHWGTPYNNMNMIGNQIGYSGLLVVALGLGYYAFRKVKLSL